MGLFMASELIGSRLGNYEITEEIGAGGMATVYRAMQQVLNREVALKVLSPVLVHQEGFLTRFKQEALTVAALDHPNILPLFDFASGDRHTYLTMPLMRGGTLRDRMRGRPLQLQMAWKVIADMGSALGHAHASGIVHRDLKPSNVLVHADGRHLLSDFGLARSLHHEHHLTFDGTALGSPGYMAPEQAKGEAIDQRADVYALGVIVHEMLTGHLPFRGSSHLETMALTVGQPYRSAREHNPALPREVDDVLEILLAKSPDQRPRSVREAVEMLAALPFNGTGGHAYAAPATPVTPLPPATPFPGRAPAIPSVTPYPVTPFESRAAILPALGLARLVARQPYCRNSYFANLIQCARDSAGPAWPELVRNLGMRELLHRDPAGTDDLGTPARYVSRLDDALEATFGPAAPARMRDWAFLAADRWARAGRKSGLRGMLGRKGVSAVLEAFALDQDEIRGEHLHVVRQLDQDEFWIIHYSNAHAVGRRAGAAGCHFQTGSLEAALSRAGLLNQWRVEEIECGAGVGSGDCIFAIRHLRPGR